MLLEFVWTMNPEVVSFLPIRWYGIMFACSFIIGQYILNWAYKHDNTPVSLVEKFATYAIAGTIIGARAGHMFFYDFKALAADPMSLFRVWEGGLASHGGGIGLFITCYIFYKKYKLQLPSYLWVLDKTVIVVAIAGCFIRFGNFMNSEIVGKPTNAPTSVLFANPIMFQYENNEFIEKISVEQNLNIPKINVNNINYNGYTVTFNFDSSVSKEDAVMNLKQQIIPGINEKKGSEKHFKITDFTVTNLNNNSYSINAYGIPRHPAQLYESFSCLVLFVGLIFLNKKKLLPNGSLFGIFMAFVFSLRFFYEFLKENQKSWESENLLNQGQILSIPMVIIGLFVLFYAFKKKEEISNV